MHEIHLLLYSSSIYHFYLCIWNDYIPMALKKIENVSFSIFTCFCIQFYRLLDRMVKFQPLLYLQVEF